MLQQCMNCGHGGWNCHELKDGLCPSCREYDGEEDGCAEYKEQELIEEMQREQHLYDLQWHENMNSLYTWDEGGFCDGFTK